MSIIPTSKGALGYTMEMPEGDRLLISKPALEQRLAVMLGGRAAELLIEEEIRRFLDEAHENAMEILTRNEPALHEIAQVIQNEEVIDGEAMARNRVRKTVGLIDAF